jgi:hypothetical protein
VLSLASAGLWQTTNRRALSHSPRPITLWQERLYELLSALYKRLDRWLTSLAQPASKVTKLTNRRLSWDSSTSGLLGAKREG